VDIATLRRAYLCGQTSPTEQVERCLAQRQDPDWAMLWITPANADRLRQQARQLEEQRRAPAALLDSLPLYGVLFAVKDNIDVAGMPTTAGCPAFAYTPECSAPVVERLEAAGAILVGKTNLDQFATGLVGTRSPYGAVPNALQPAYIAGGSSSGSAVAVARGLVSFALGTDTAGSGRVPAGLNNIVGLKPSRGLVSARGVVPACQSLDCVSIFTLTVPDAATVLQVVRGFDNADPHARQVDLAPDICQARFRFGIPDTRHLEFFGDAYAQASFEQSVAIFASLGGEAVEVDFTPFLEAAALLYEGPWVAERLAALSDFFASHASDMHEVVRTIIGGSTRYSAADLFSGQTQIETLKKRVAPTLAAVDVLVVPTVPTVYTRAQVLAEPYHTNRNLGYYTNFVNLLDLAALAVPTCLRADGLPAGVTLLQQSGSDLMLADLGTRLHAATGLTLGATGQLLPQSSGSRRRGDTVEVAVVGAHLSGQPLNHQLLERDGRLLQTCRTAPCYRLYALPDSTPPKPGLVRDAAGAGCIIEVEVWRLPLRHYGSFVAMIPSPLGIGRVELENGSWVQGFLCEPWALTGAEDISHCGGWRAWLAQRCP
jgi:allophanate hydrolase